MNDIVTKSVKASVILRAFFEQTKQYDDEAMQTQKIIATSATLIKTNIKTNVPYITNQYPTSMVLKLDSTLSYIPETLRLLFASLFVGTTIDDRLHVSGKLSFRMCDQELLLRHCRLA